MKYTDSMKNYSAITKDMPLGTKWMEIEVIILTEMNKEVKGQVVLFSFI